MSFAQEYSQTSISVILHLQADSINWGLKILGEKIQKVQQFTYHLPYIKYYK